MRQWLLLSACLFLGAALAVADDKDKKDDKKDDKTKSEPTVVPTEIAVNRKLDNKQFPYSFNADNTRVSFLVKYPGKQILGVDSTSKLASMKDDKGNSLIDEKSSFQPNFSPYSQVAQDRTAVLVSVGTYGKAPGKGATKVTVKGDLVLSCGTDEKSEKSEKFKFEAKAKAKAGNFEVTVVQEKGGFGSEGPLFSMSSKTRAVKSFVVKDGDGKAVELFARGWFGNNDNWTFNYALAKPLEEGTIHVTYFSKEEKVKVPIDVTVGLGLGE